MANKASPVSPFADSAIADYERCLLCAYIMGADIGARVNKDVFLSGAHKVIFQVIKDLKGRGVEADLITLVSELEKRGQLDAAGGPAYVAALTNTVASTANKSFYESEVLTASQRLNAWKVFVTAIEALKNRESPDAVFTRVAAELEAVTGYGVTAECGILFSDLLKKRFPPEDWLVEGLITTGLSVLTGASKIGKSWAALQLVTALDRGGCLWGALKASRCDVLYCALEDTPKRIQGRLQKQGIAAFNGSRLETKRRTTPDLRAFLKANPQFRVVIIDTFQKMMGISDLNDYSQTVNGMSALKDIADSLSIAVIVIHHNRKGADADGDHMESALGSIGINATADATLTMRRKRGTGEATLSVTGRDVEDTAYTLSWDRDLCSWAVTDRGALKPALSEAQRQIIDLLESEARNWSNGEIVEATGKSQAAICNILKRLQETGLIESPARGQWRKP
ncbi:MAG: AAA family ATPase [Spirochaetaceae bacterium]|jgi:DNA-binding transcriptional ArsR family regulator|nr:AAA family ATPase [Spirochaetaceae bacterium]